MILMVLMPETVTGKLLLQELWKLKMGWDQIVPEDIIIKWNSYCNDLSNVALNIDRSCIVKI